MDNVIDLKLREIEEEYERPLWERAGKVAVVAIVGFVVTLAAEAVYDHFTLERRKKKAEAETTES